MSFLCSYHCRRCPTHIHAPVPTFARATRRAYLVLLTIDMHLIMLGPLALLALPVPVAVLSLALSHHRSKLSLTTLPTCQAVTGTPVMPMRIEIRLSLADISGLTTWSLRLGRNINKIYMLF